MGDARVSTTTRSDSDNVFALMRRLRTLDDAAYLQTLIAYHAAPTLLGIKPATLICPAADGRNLGQALKQCAHCLGRDFGVELAGLHNRAGALLILVYRSRLLRSVLAAREVVELLAEAGYDAESADVEGLLETLRCKCGGQCFPHEIGVFLGYPPRDVRAFMTQGGRGARASGCWRIYGDEERAKRRNEAYRRCKQRAAELLVDGADLGGVVAGLRKQLAAA